MKKILLGLLILLTLAGFCGLQKAYGQGVIGILSPPMCANTSDSSLLCEDFDNTSATYCVGTTGAMNCRNTWINTDGLAIFDAVNSSSPFHCAGVSKYSLAINRSGTNIVTYKTFTNSNSVYGLAWVKITTAMVSNGVERAFVAQSKADDSASNFALYMKGDGTYSYFHAHYRSAADTELAAFTQKLTNNTWYLIDWAWIANTSFTVGITPEGGSREVKTACASGCDTASVPANNQGGRITFQAITSNYGFQVDNIKIHTSAPTCN